MDNQDHKQEVSLDNIYLFKVSDYTTILLGRFEDDDDGGAYYVQRGDGAKCRYDAYRIVWKQRLECRITNEDKMKKTKTKKSSDNEDFSLMMKTFRSAIKASTSAMSEICGLGANGWRIYENDSSNIAKSKKNIIRFACTPTGFWNLLQMSSLSDKKKDKLMEKTSLMLLELEKEVFDFKAYKIKNYWRRFL